MARRRPSQASGQAPAPSRIQTNSSKGGSNPLRRARNAEKAAVKKGKSVLEKVYGLNPF